jgi:hypothetical protein
MHDIVFAETAAGLDLDDLQGFAAGILDAVLRADRDAA